jgi:hypothetical protein
LKNGFSWGLTDWFLWGIREEQGQYVKKALSFITYMTFILFQKETKLKIVTGSVFHALSSTP